MAGAAKKTVRTKSSNSSEYAAYTFSRSLKNDPEFASRVELLQDFDFEEASHCVRVSEDGDWVMSTGTYKVRFAPALFKHPTDSQVASNPYSLPPPPLAFLCAPYQQSEPNFSSSLERLH
jgi:hypothetical protein